MEELPTDILPDPSQTEPVVKHSPVPRDVKEPNLPSPPPVEEVSHEEVTEPKGSKTPDDNLYAALKEERQKRKEAEDEERDSA